MFLTLCVQANVELFRDQPEVWKFLVAPVALAVFAADLGTDPRHVGLTVSHARSLFPSFNYNWRRIIWNFAVFGVLK